MQKFLIVILLQVLPSGSNALSVRQSPKLSLAVSNHSYAKDCTPRSNRKHSYSALEWEEALKKGKSLPGVGVDLKKINPYETVYKDGFSYVDCVKDVSYHERDMHGNGKFSYKAGNTNVSIIHYTEIVPKEDQKKMTIEVCFKFCRTLQHMNFFGIHSGRDCYCSPFFQRSAGDSSQCDAVCEGDKSKFCGGMKKSAVWELHMCNDLGSDMMSLRWDSDKVMHETNALASTAKVLADDMTAAADEEQTMWGMHGDPNTANLMQTTKVWAGEILKLVDAAEKACEDLSWSIQKTESMKDFNFLVSDLAKEAEVVIKNLEKGKMTTEGARDLLQIAYDKAHRGVGKADGRGKEYYPIMYFVKNTEYEHALSDYPSTCTGDWDTKTVYNTNYEECARACDDAVLNPECQAFFLSENSLCFLFSKVTKVQYYTECPFDIHYKYHKEHHKHFHHEPIKGAQPHFLAKKLPHSRHSLIDLLEHKASSNATMVEVEPTLDGADIQMNNLDFEMSTEMPQTLIIEGIGPGLNLKIDAHKGYKAKNHDHTGFKGKDMFEINVAGKSESNGEMFKATFDFTFIDENYNEVVVENIPFTVYDLDGEGNNPIHPEKLTISGFDSYHVDPETYLKISKQRGGADSGAYTFEATHWGVGADNPTDPFTLGPTKASSGLNSLWASVGFLFKHTSKFTVTFETGMIKSGRNFEFGFKSTHTEEIPRTTTPAPTTTVFTTPTTTTAAPTPAPTKAAIVEPEKTEIEPPKKEPPTKAPPVSLTTTQFPTPTTTPMGPGRPAGCYAKLEYFQGTDLNPELYTAATGRNDLALKELKRAERCYK